MAHKVFHRESSSSTAYRRIGAGFCGSVWGDPEHHNVDSSVAIKREDGGPGRSLFNDFQIHKILITAYNECPQHIQAAFQIPECHEFVPDTYAGWTTTTLLNRFPQGYTACNILITQRIPPFPEQARHALTDKFCPTHLIENIKADTNNLDCLVRPYLGRRKFGQCRSKLRVFSLRNYPLHIDQMSDLGLDAFGYSTAIARALAFMYWKGKIDANDVEFVLAPAPDFALSQFHSAHLGGHNLWILDFDCCKSMSMNKEGVHRAAQAFLRNDPFYPCPGRENKEDQELWKHFRAQFLEASSYLLHDDDEASRILPNLLMETIEKFVQESSAGQQRIHEPVQ
ncbi:hypothetical protein PFICI_15283 [Pestalotiopsis fici W106-1]|uniref:DUF3669 domain-containing protein n=1 Tax=Pestalotiopsis fici (strain W106-1 / CGMCC3.15140) TaxID=1229662 RepID=W3WGT0_PESFW|nr:uncharacterized protein PFICI_15283 [Pestalotiopsis fici W106-1]ETS73108.1 hypothetical protein PFICI_15283 [Pestalotiopsis fici W106-1]